MGETAEVVAPRAAEVPMVEQEVVRRIRVLAHGRVQPPPSECRPFSTGRLLQEKRPNTCGPSR